MDDELDELDFFRDFQAVQKELPKLSKKGQNPHFGNTYVTLADLMEAVLPVLHEHNFALTQEVSHIDENPVLKTWLWHSTGNQLASEMLLMTKTADPQGQGSAITYARRYALMALLGLVGDEDDDGNRANETAASPTTVTGPKGKVTNTSPATENQLRALANMFIGFSKQRLNEDNVWDAIKQAFGVQKSSEISRADVSEMMAYIRREKALPLTDDYTPGLDDGEQPKVRGGNDEDQS